MTRRLLLAALFFAALAALAWAFTGPVQRWQQRRMLASAGAFLARGDLRSASLDARQVLRLDPSNRRAIEILARAAEAAGSPEAVLWQQRLVEASPGDTSAILGLVRVALRFGEIYLADKALAEIPPAQRDSAAFHSTAVMLAMEMGRLADAEAHLGRAIALDPSNQFLLLDRATVWLKSGDSAKTAAARETLARLAPVPALRPAALRALLADARRAGDSPLALRIARDLTREPGATPGDWLLLLEELQHAGSPDLATELYFQQQSATDPARIGLLLEWMNAHGMAGAALDWAGSLPKETAALMPVPLMKAEALSLENNWSQLHVHLLNNGWGGLEFLRDAFRARAMFETGNHRKSEEFAMRWDRAIVNTGGSQASLSMLAKLVQGWGWNTEAAQVWWLLAARTSGQRPALKELYRIYSGAKNTRELHRVALRILELEPDNPVAKNNAAMLSLLLRTDMESASRLAGEIHKSHPREPAFASTLAFARYREGKSAEGIELMRSVPAAMLRHPPLAACMGVLLTASGKKEEARPYLDLARDSDALLPEERALVEQALDQL